MRQPYCCPPSGSEHPLSSKDSVEQVDPSIGKQPGGEEYLSESQSSRSAVCLRFCRMHINSRFVVPGETTVKVRPPCETMMPWVFWAGVPSRSDSRYSLTPNPLQKISAFWIS